MTDTRRRWTGQTQDQRRSERRTMLIASAARLYGAHGFASTGVRAVCRDAGLSERYFYESFANSEELLLATFNEVVAYMYRQIRDADDRTAHADERARMMLHAYFSALRADPRSARVFLVEVLGVDPAIDRAFEASLIRLTQPIVDVLDACGGGPLSTDRLLQRAVAGGLLHLALAWGAEGYARPISGVVDTALILCKLEKGASPAKRG